MTPPPRRLILAAAAFATLCCQISVRAQEPVGEKEATATPERRPLDHDSYDRWNSVRASSISANGNWVMYTLTPGKGDATLLIRERVGETNYETKRASSASFSADGKQALYLINPDPDELKKARKEKVEKEREPKKKLEILDLSSGTRTTIERVKGYRLPEKNGGWVAYLLEKPAGEPRSTTGDKESEAGTSEEPPAEPAAPAEPRAPGRGRRGGGRPGGDGADGGDDENPVGTELILRNLEDGAEFHFSNVVEYVFSESGDALFFSTSSEDGEGNGVSRVVPGNGKAKLLAGGPGRYKSLVVDKASRQLAFLVQPAPPPEKPIPEGEQTGDEAAEAKTETSAEEKPAGKPEGKSEPATAETGEKKAGPEKAKSEKAKSTKTDEDNARRKPEPPRPWSIHLWTMGSDHAQAVATDTSDGYLDGHWIADRRRPSFSESGRRLFFGTAPRPEPPAEEEEDKDEEEDDTPDVKLDVWHWQDPRLQPEQLLRASRERNRTYLAVLHISEGHIAALERPGLTSVDIRDREDLDVVLGSDDTPYLLETSWSTPGHRDVYTVDVRTGEKSLLLEKLQGSAALSPLGKFVTWWNYDELAWYCLSLSNRKQFNLTELLPHPVHNELHDTPSPTRAYGSAGWVENDQAFLVYDKHDLWGCNPTGFWPPFAVTDGVGREQNLRFRYVRLDPDEKSVPAKETILLSSLDLGTKASGFYTDRVRSREKPESLIALDERISTPRKAEEAEVFLFTRSTFEQFPDLWTSTSTFQDLRRMSDANPQQKEYTWGTAELVEWTSLDGEVLQGILHKPEGFDPAKKYPMMVYFYERSSNNLHRYHVPAGSRSSINYSFYVSRGYVLFVPDIPYRIGYPGQSSLRAVLPGVSHLIDQGFVDKERVGVQGHSWGGYQIAYLVTQSNIFACAESGAPVSNMTSAYGGIRWASGKSRMFQYEQTQSRIGDTLWKAHHKYIENSPVFWADKVETPLLILHNDKDGAVPWYQGIELFVSLRRLGKPAWMLNYNGEAHGLGQDQNKRDFAIRMQQFFDHYLKDAPAPVWLAKGVPAVQKGETLGLELIKPDR